MRLKSLDIKEYKKIKERTFDFSHNTGYSALIGENGSCKSNVGGKNKIGIRIKKLNTVPEDVSKTKFQYLKCSNAEEK